MDMLASAEADEEAGVEETRSLLDTEAGSSSGDDVTEADGREDTAAVGVCERFGRLSS